MKNWLSGQIKYIHKKNNSFPRSPHSDLKYKSIIRNLSISVYSLLDIDHCLANSEIYRVKLSPSQPFTPLWALYHLQRTIKIEVEAKLSTFGLEVFDFRIISV